MMMKMQVGLGFGSTAAGASNSPICEGCSVHRLLATSTACWWLPRHNATSSCTPRHRLLAGDRVSLAFTPQGLGDGPYYFVMWAWHLLLYCAFVMVFCIFGGLIGLKVTNERCLLGGCHLLAVCTHAAGWCGTACRVVRTRLYPPLPAWLPADLHPQLVLAASRVLLCVGPERDQLDLLLLLAVEGGSPGGAAVRHLDHHLWVRNY